MISTVDIFESAIRSTLGEKSLDRILSEDVLTAINDGAMAVSALAMCVEHTDSVSTSAGNRFIRFAGHSVTDVVVSMTGKALPKIIPQMVGHVLVSGYVPQYWFQWGQFVVLEPEPDSDYGLFLSVSDYPSSSMERNLLIFEDSGLIFQDQETEWQKDDLGDSPTDIPLEFHSCVIDFALHVLTMKLRRWADTSKYYNRFIGNLLKIKAEYINRTAAARSSRMIPSAIGG